MGHLEAHLQEKGKIILSQERLLCAILAYTKYKLKTQGPTKVDKQIFSNFQLLFVVQSNCGLASNLLQQNFFQRHLIVGWLFNNILKIRQNRLGETCEKLAMNIFNLQHRKPNFRKLTNSDKTSDNCVLFFLKNFRCNIANVFWVVLF